MKTPASQGFLTTVALILLASLPFSTRADITNYVDSAYALPYTGPADSTAFSNFLLTSTAPAITSLDAGTKASLVQYLAFSGGLPRGMTGTDQNIQNLYQSGGIQGVLNALYGTTVYVRTNEIDQYLTLDQVVALGADLEPSCCENCRYPYLIEGPCCQVGGDGCEDTIAFSGTNIYRVDVPFPVANAGSNLTIYAGQSVPLGQPPAAGYAYSWSPATGLSATNVANPIASPTTTTTYTFIVAAAPEVTVTNRVTITVAVPMLSLNPAGNKFVISWPINDSNAVLQEANTILGPWSNVIGVSNPWSITPTNAVRFYRLHQ